MDWADRTGQDEPQILAKLEREVRQVLAEPEIREKLKVQYMEPVGNSSQEFRSLLEAELERWDQCKRTTSNSASDERSG